MRGLRAYLQLPLGSFVTLPCVPKDFLKKTWFCAPRGLRNAAVLESTCYSFFDIRALNCQWLKK